jgi:hypothetical protein
LHSIEKSLGVVTARNPPKRALPQRKRCTDDRPITH